jgi:hypothetical protein
MRWESKVSNLLGFQRVIILLGNAKPAANKARAIMQVRELSARSAQRKEVSNGISKAT